VGDTPSSGAGVLTFRTGVISATCDLNGDGIVDAADVAIAKDQALGVSPCTTADLDGNGTCNVIDVQRVVNASMGLGCKVGP
jgi:hypothetical protein